MMGEAATSGDVATAAARLAGVAHRTPVVTSRTLDERTGGGAYLKCEQFQRGGAFKFRGAYNRLAQLDGAGRLGGAVAYSSGNHAQGVALAARVLGISATIVMPADAPAAKLAATRGYGARVVTYDRATEDRDALARAVADDLGATLVPPFDDPDIIAGQGTVARELLEDVPDLDALLVCVGGGGLLAAAHSPPRRSGRTSSSGASSPRRATISRARCTRVGGSRSRSPRRSRTGCVRRRPAG